MSTFIGKNCYTNCLIYSEFTLTQNVLSYTIYHYGQNLFNHKYFDPRVNIFDLPRCKVVYY